MGKMNKDHMASLDFRMPNIQHKLLISLGFTCFTFSGFLFNLPFLVDDDPFAQNIGNYFLLYEDDYYLRYYIKYSFYASFPVGGLVLTFISDKIGRKLIIKYLLMWELVFLVFAGITFCPHFIIITSFLLGFLAFTGISACFLLIIESVDRQYRAVYISGLLFSVFFSLLSVTILNILRFNWRTIILGNSLLAGLSLLILKNYSKSNDWPYGNFECEESETVTPNTEQQAKEVDEIEKTEEDIKRDSKFDLMKIFVLYVNTWITCMVLMKVIEGITWNIYWERGILGCVGCLFSITFGSFLHSKSFLDFWNFALCLGRGCIAILYALPDDSFKVLFFVIIVGSLIYEFIALILVIGIRARPNVIHFVFGVFNMVVCCVGFALNFFVFNDVNSNMLYCAIMILIISSVLPAFVIKSSLNTSYYSLLPQDLQVNI